MRARRRLQSTEEATAEKKKTEEEATEEDASHKEGLEGRGKISSVYECLQVFTSVYKLFTSCLQEQKPAWCDAGRCKTAFYVFVYKIYRKKE